MTISPFNDPIPNFELEQALGTQYGGKSQPEAEGVNQKGGSCSLADPGEGCIIVDSSSSTKISVCTDV